MEIFVLLDGIKVNYDEKKYINHIHQVSKVDQPSNVKRNWWFGQLEI